MAFSPCPECQSKQQFDKMKLDDAGFLVQQNPSEANDHVKYQCTRNAGHFWRSYENLKRALKYHGYEEERC